MKLFEVLGNWDAYYNSVTMKLAKEIYEKAGGDVKKARGMGMVYGELLLKTIDKYHKELHMDKEKHPHLKRHYK
jgi:hypothetical protein